MTTPTRLRPRPLSPHLQVYRWQISNSLSILHRITGFGLVLGLPLLTAWLFSAAYAPESFESIAGFLSGWLGMLLMFGWSAAFFYHLANGIRHLGWDAGYGFTIPVMTKTGWTVVGFTILATAALWLWLLIGA